MEPSNRSLTSHRQMDHERLVLIGLGSGTLCYLLAGLLTPRAGSIQEHDLWLTQRLGFILVPALALGLGWLQRSWRRALIGGVFGLLIGWFCHRLCESTFQPILPALPILLGGVFAAFCGSQRADWLQGLGARLAKGLLVGFVIGVVYIALLSLGSLLFWPRAGDLDYTAAYIRMTWRAGPLAFSLVGALLFPSIRWAAALTQRP
ncbi:MAG TPA: hypothetical protein DD490_12905 [Acidobacteria bacterium]|nr:hypothetical protein [Acidobacteriota bacterium]